MTEEQLRDDLEKAEARLHELAGANMIRVAADIRTIRLDLVGALERGDLTRACLEDSLGRMRHAGADWERLSELQDQLNAPRETATQRLVDQVNETRTSQREGRQTLSDEEFEVPVSMLTHDQVGAGDHVTLLGGHWKVFGTRIVTGSTEFLLTRPEQHDNLLWHYRTTGSDLHMRVRATGTADDQRPYVELAQSWDEARAAEDFPSEETP